MDGAGEAVGVGIREDEAAGLSHRVVDPCKDFAGLALEQDGESEQRVGERLGERLEREGGRVCVC